MRLTEAERAAFWRLLKWRRDVRHFQDRPVTAEQVQQLRQAIDCAPSVGNSRPWRIFEVASPALRQSVHQIFLAANKQAATGYSDAKLQQYLQLRLEGLETAPVQLAIFTDTEPEQGHGLGRQSMAVTLEHSTAMAVQNPNLAARALGLGVGMVSILEPVAMEHLFQVPANWRFSLYLCIGWPVFEDDTPLLHRNRWQENTASVWRTV